MKFIRFITLKLGCRSRTSPEVECSHYLGRESIKKGAVTCLLYTVTFDGSQHCNPLAFISVREGSLRFRGVPRD